MRKPDRTVPDLPAGWGELDVLGLDEAGVLGFVVEQQRVQDQAAAAQLRGVTAWADRHRVGDPEGEGHGSVDADVDAVVSEEALARARAGDGWSFAGPGGVEGLLRLCGQNAYLLTEFAISELAAALRISETGARRLSGQALELRDRLPRLWGRVMSGTCRRGRPVRSLSRPSRWPTGPQDGSMRSSRRSRTSCRWVASSSAWLRRCCGSSRSGPRSWPGRPPSGGGCGPRTTSTGPAPSPRSPAPRTRSRSTTPSVRWPWPLSSSGWPTWLPGRSSGSPRWST